jgi:flavodoxin/NAD-dependent dihydropyrimidine dehydrogenase PreA subunit
MKILAICFSQTGNTLNVAQRIVEGIKEVEDSCELVKLSDVNTDSLADYDLVGLGCPVLYYKEPLNMRDFIENLPDLKGKHWFIFCTHGSVLATTMISMTERLTKKGVVVVGGHHTYSDATLPFYPYPTLTTGHPDAIDLEQARSFGREVVQRSKRIAQGDSSLIFKPAPVTDEWTIGEAEMLSADFMRQVMPQLQIDMGKCTFCRECEEGCPVNGIDIDASPPHIQSPCIYCWYCAKTCPVQAIETDWTPLVNMAPEQYARYRQALDEAHARGEYRWLIDPNTLNFDDPLYRQRQRELLR